MNHIIVMREVDFDTGATALYEAIGVSDWDAASKTCQSKPIEAETWVVRRESERRDNIDEDGGNIDASNDGSILWRFLPLHSACARRPPSSFVSDLLQAYPEAASLKDESGMYPLHYACGNRASKNVIKQLLECFPEATGEADPSGMLPLHYIAQFGPSEEGIVELLLAHHNGVLSLNAEERNPMDLCREGNFAGWQAVLAEMENQLQENNQNESVNSHSIKKKLNLSSEKGDGEKDGHGDSLVSSTIEIRKSKAMPRPSSRSRGDRSSPRSRRMRKPSQSKRSLSRSLAEKVTNQAGSNEEKFLPRSGRQPSPLGSKSRTDMKISYIETRDEVSTLRDHRFERRLSLAEQTLECSLPSISCSLASPRYHEMKTPRSSGGRPRSSGRTMDFGFENESSILSHESSHGSAVNVKSMPQEENSQKPKNVREDAQYKGLQAKNGNTELSVKLAKYDTMQDENGQLRAKLANYESENVRLHAKIDMLEEVQARLNEILVIAQRRENARAQSTAERRKMLLEMMASEEKDQAEQSNFLFEGEMIWGAFGLQMRKIDEIRRDMLGH